jgi:hypothetical protein
MRGRENTTGIGLVEVFDLNQATTANLANISTRGPVEGGDNILIGGFIAGSRQGPTNVIVRALGPSLSRSGVPNPLQDPTLELIDQNGTVLNANDDFASSPERDQITARGLAPQDEREAALMQLVAPGNYTGVVRGKDNSTGVALVEVYDVP